MGASALPRTWIATLHQRWCRATVGPSQRAWFPQAHQSHSDQWCWASCRAGLADVAPGLCSVPAPEGACPSNLTGSRLGSPNSGCAGHGSLLRFLAICYRQKFFGADSAKACDFARLTTAKSRRQGCANRPRTVGRFPPGSRARADQLRSLTGRQDQEGASVPLL